MAKVLQHWGILPGMPAMPGAPTPSQSPTGQAPTPGSMTPSFLGSATMPPQQQQGQQRLLGS